MTKWEYKIVAYSINECPYSQKGRIIDLWREKGWETYRIENGDQDRIFHLRRVVCKEPLSKPWIVECPACGGDMELERIGSKPKKRNKLKPCAHCGGVAWIDVMNYSTIFVRCTNCYIQTDSCQTKEGAIKIWNRRA